MVVEFTPETLAILVHVYGQAQLIFLVASLYTQKDKFYLVSKDL